jgi:lysophospholipase L1-like esterase
MRSRQRRAISRAAFVLFMALLAGAALRPLVAGADESGWLVRSIPMRIVALGDSITAGAGEHGKDLGTGGYRGELQHLLEANGYRFAMAGSRRDYSARLRMRGHEGHPGFVIRSFSSAPAPQLYGAVTRAALERYDPRVVLLMAGTNDLLRKQRRAAGYTLSNIVESMDALLAQIFYEKPGVDVIVAGIVSSPSIDACDVARFDGVAGAECGGRSEPNIRTLVEAYAARGFHIVLAPRMDAAVPRDKQHFPDGIHPSGPGAYEAMARVWLAAIETASTTGSRGTLAGR